MLSIDKYYKTKINGQVDYLLANDQIQIPNNLEEIIDVDVDGTAGVIDIDAPLNGNKRNAVIARYVGYSSSEDVDVYEVTCVGGSKFLTAYDACDNSLFNGNMTEYAKTVLSNQNRAFVNTTWNLFANPMHVASIIRTKDGYDTTSDAGNDNNSITCYYVTMTTGEAFITDNTGLAHLDGGLR